MMAAWRWAGVIVLGLGMAPAVSAQQQPQSGEQPQQTPSSQQSSNKESSQPSKSSTQELPSAPQPQPTAGQKSPDSQKPPSAPPPQRRAAPPGEPDPYGPDGPSSSSQPPRTTPPESSGSSTSKEDKVDISPPSNDAKEHPNAGLDDSDVGEFHPFDPHRAAKDVEVGDFYYKQGNYRAAISRYREALLYKPNDAIATYRLADALERAGNLAEATQSYRSYLKILPYGPKAKDAQRALERLKGKGVASGKTAAQK
jgi:tetratricopeptide (TPR) repeat protein